MKVCAMGDMTPETEVNVSKYKWLSPEIYIGYFEFQI